MVFLKSDPWLTEILSRPVFRIGLEDTLADGVLDDLRALPPGSFCYAKTHTTETKSVQILEDMNFHIIEVALTFEAFARRSHSIFADGIAIREAIDSDEEAVAQIAHESFSHTRFHRDPNLAEHGNRIKEAWVRNFFRGARGERLIVGTENGRVSGFLQLLELADGMAVIDLIAVQASSRGKGLARSMIKWGCFNDSRYGGVRVGTQANNYPSIRTYESMGFRLSRASYILHFHHPQASESRVD